MRLYGLIGYPLGHSFSKQYFTEKFLREGLTDCFFEAFPIRSIKELPLLIKNNPFLNGLSVTIPYKEQVLSFVDGFSDEVRFIGATNSIKISPEGKLTAYNTDIIGFEQSFRLELRPSHLKALVLGTGGASKAVQFVLQKMGIPFLLVSRNPDSGKERVIAYSALDENIMREFKIIINCTPVGMAPKENECPDIPYHWLTPEHYLYDLVYKPGKTLFLGRGESAGAVVKNGFDMLIIQAEASWKIWNT